VIVVAALVLALGSASASASPLPGAPLCPMFPADSFWHADVSNLPVAANSGTYIQTAGSNSPLHADFGSGTWDGGPIGIPFTTVPGTQPKVPMSFDYADESDPGPYPFPPDAPIEGGAQSTGDRHVLVVDSDACKLYETFASYPLNGGASWQAGSGAVFDMTSDALRPATWTSADAAGLAILPGLVRYDEVASGNIDHAIRMTVRSTDQRFIWPARHEAGSNNPSAAPMGAWFRLKASFDVSHFPADDQVILRAMQQHGMIVADNGSSWYISGAPDPRWNNDDLHQLGALHGSDFEMVDTSGLMADPNSGAVDPAPTPPTPPRGGYTLDAYGGLHPFGVGSGSAPGVARGGAYWPGRDLARAVAVEHSGAGGLELDAYGGLHPFAAGAGAAPGPPSGAAYWPGWDIARGVALLPGGGGYVLDGWGGIHAFRAPGGAAPPAVHGAPYWPGRDVARGIALLPGGTGGYVVDSLGVLHPFSVGGNAPPPAPRGAWRSAGGLAQDVALSADGTGGYTLDAYGGLHPFAVGFNALAPPARGAAAWPGWNVARGVGI
jgi:hypothetical protein